ncbi:hypothetical protein [Curtobacterium sp. MCBA15_016]|uniref:hypothetical protein n=1 Tax=Curtobacterium sp. MCBA15_016 TaxID=1898740 RepID=UPI00111446D0|nr:hypothetical protein [Curtobacterium sp. MCBA15_016]
MKKSEIAAARARVALLEDEGTKPPQWLTDIASISLDGAEDRAASPAAEKSESPAGEKSEDPSVVKVPYVDLPNAIPQLFSAGQRLSSDLARARFDSGQWIFELPAQARAETRPSGPLAVEGIEHGSLAGVRGVLPRQLWDALDVTPKAGFRIVSSATGELVSIRVEAAPTDGNDDADSAAQYDPRRSPRT